MHVFLFQDAGLIRLSAIVGKTHLKFFTSEEDAALDSAEREVHLFGDFIVLVPGDVHGERNTVVRREIR